MRRGALHWRNICGNSLSDFFPGATPAIFRPCSVTDFTMAETGISHHLPQLMGAVVMPVLAFLSLVWIDWRMAVAMFAALPVALLVLWMSTSVQKKLSGKQIQAKINAGNRLEEYLQGIRVMKAYNLLGDRFVRLRDAFAELRRACIRQEAMLGPFVLLSITLVRAGLTLMVLCGTYLLLGGELSLLVFVLFLVVGSRVFDPLTSALTNFVGVPLLLHCRRAYSHADERAGDGRRTAGAGHRRHPVRACVVRLSGQDGAAGRFHCVFEEHADGSRRSFGQREKYGDETLRPILRPAAGGVSFSIASR